MRERLNHIIVEASHLLKEMERDPQKRTPENCQKMEELLDEGKRLKDSLASSKDSALVKSR